MVYYIKSYFLLSLVKYAIAIFLIVYTLLHLQKSII